MRDDDRNLPITSAVYGKRGRGSGKPGRDDYDQRHAFRVYHDESTFQSLLRLKRKLSR